MPDSGWVYDELRQVGTDFEDAGAVAAYDRNQGARVERERTLIARLGLGPGASVIDLGCGTASFALEAARAGIRVFAVDVSRAMLTYAQSKAEADGLDGLSFHRGGFLTYRHGAAPVDAVVSRYALHHLPDFWKMAALVRIATMLKDEGQFYLEDVAFSFEPLDYRAGIESWIKAVAKPAGEGFTRDDFETHVREEYSTFGWILETMLARAGFRVDAADYASGAYASYLCIKPGA